MAVIDDIRALPVLPVEVEVDEAAARRTLRDQIARLERQLGDALVSAFPHVAVDVRVPTAARGPRVLTLRELERHRDALAEKLREVRGILEARGAEIEANRVLLERMLANPKRYKFARLHRGDVEMGGCGAYQVRPRLGIIGMLAGWWHVKLSSGCPLATSQPRQDPAARTRAGTRLTPRWVDAAASARPRPASAPSPSRRPAGRAARGGRRRLPLPGPLA